MPSDNTTQLQAVIDLAGRGNQDAWKQLINQASQRLFRLTRKMLNSYPHLRRWEESDDVFQTVAIRLQRSLNNLQPTSVREFFGLATVEIRRSLIVLIRHHFGPEGRAAHHHSDFPDQEGSADDQTAAQTQAADHVRPDAISVWERFHQSVANLPEEPREVFQLVWYTGLSQQDVGDLLGVSIPTVKRRMRAARLWLYDAMDGESPVAAEA